MGIGQRGGAIKRSLELVQGEAEVGEIGIIGNRDPFPLDSTKIPGERKLPSLP